MPARDQLDAVVVVRRTGTRLNADAETPRNAEPDTAIAGQVSFHHGIACRGVANHGRIALETTGEARPVELRTLGVPRRNGATPIAARGAIWVEERPALSRVVAIGGASPDGVRSE